MCVSQEFRSSLASWLCLRDSHEIVVDNFLRLQSFEILTGLGKLTSNMVPSCGYWQKISLHTALGRGLQLLAMWTSPCVN